MWLALERLAMRERESVERGTLCSFRRGSVSMWEGIAGKEVDRYQEQKEWTERPRGLVSPYPRRLLQLRRGLQRASLRFPPPESQRP